MKKWFYICTSAVIAGFIAFVITFVKYDIDYDNKKEILPIKTDNEKHFSIAQSSIMINPESLDRASTEENNITDENIQEVTTEPIKYFNPVSGNVIREYANENLIYSKTLNEWATHNGIDIEAKAGSDVRSIYKGTISKISFDYMYGNVIEIEHSDGYKSIYAGIEVVDKFKIGDSVNDGDIIGKITDSYGVELAEVSHLHFELLKDSSYINPEELLKYCER